MKKHHTAQLSAIANAEEYMLPKTTIAEYIAKTFRLAWGNVNGETQPYINHHGLTYPHLRTPTRIEIAEYKAARAEMRAAGKTYISKYN